MQKKYVDNILKVLRHLRIAFFPLAICYLELVLHYYAYRSFDKNTVWIILFSLGFGSVCTFLTSVFPKKVNHVLTYVFISVVTVIFEVQCVYFSVFKGFAPVSSAKLGPQAVTNFTGGMIEGIKSALLWIILLLLPLILYILYDIFVKCEYSRGKWIRPVAAAVASALILGGSVGTLAVFFSGIPSLYHTLTSSTTSTDTGVRAFGLNMTMLQEIRFMLFPDNSAAAADGLFIRDTDGSDQADEKVDFAALYDNAGDNEELRQLTAQLSNMPLSKKNEYTGICEGYNLVAICAEAFSPEFIDPELTPTLYKLSTNGFVFNNFYSCFPNTTTNGEYTFCMGLFPDMSREKVDSSFGESADNYLPYCYGNVFREMGGISKAYHNYVADFYYRNITHPNMGYDFKAANSGLNIKISWPASDYDMMVESCPEYVASDVPFAAYYMTFSGHYQYTLENAMSAKNWDRVKDMPYSDAVKAYIACNLELEDAMTELMRQLEEAGNADKTMIVLTTDHFPYGLLDVQYAELAGREMSDIFDKLKNSFICYVPGIDPVEVDAYCSTVDIMPTVLNLLGVTYDSRLLAGCDVLDSESRHTAVLADGSFITDGVKYDASKVEFEYESDSAELRALGMEIYEEVQRKFSISSGILYNDYYSFVFDRSTTTEAIVDLTTQFEDLDIMLQAPMDYVLRNDLMDPMSETEFGVWYPYSYAEMIDTMYRKEKRPGVSIPEGWTTPFSADEKYADAVYWALENGIIADDGLTPYDLRETMSLSGCAVMLRRMADFLGADTSVDMAEADALAPEYPLLAREALEALLYCRNVDVIIGDGSPNAPFESADSNINRNTAVNLIYKFCTYNLG